MKLIFLIIPIILLCNCSTFIKAPNDGAINNLQKTIYQPRILSLEKGTKIQTIEGEYTPQDNEIWHSNKTYTELELKYINLLSEGL